MRPFDFSYYAIEETKISEESLAPNHPKLTCTSQLQLDAIPVNVTFSLPIHDRLLYGLIKLCGFVCGFVYLCLSYT